MATKVNVRIHTITIRRVLFLMLCQLQQVQSFRQEVNSIKTTMIRLIFRIYTLLEFCFLCAEKHQCQCTHCIYVKNLHFVWYQQFSSLIFFFPHDTLRHYWETQKSFVSPLFSWRASKTTWLSRNCAIKSSGEPHKLLHEILCSETCLLWMGRDHFPCKCEYSANTL